MWWFSCHGPIVLLGGSLSVAAAIFLSKVIGLREMLACKPWSSTLNWVSLSLYSLIWRLVGLSTECATGVMSHNFVVDTTNCDLVSVCIVQLFAYLNAAAWRVFSFHVSSETIFSKFTFKLCVDNIGIGHKVNWTFFPSIRKILSVPRCLEMVLSRLFVSQDSNYSSPAQTLRYPFCRVRSITPIKVASSFDAARRLGVFRPLNRVSVVSWSTCHSWN